MDLLSSELGELSVGHSCLHSNHILLYVDVRQSLTIWLCGCWRLRHNLHHMSLGNETNLRPLLRGSFFSWGSTPPKSKFRSSFLHSGKWSSGIPLTTMVLTGTHLVWLQQLWCLRVAICCTACHPWVCSLYDTGHRHLFILTHSLSLGSVVPFAFGQCPRIVQESLSNFSPSPCHISLFSAQLSMFTKVGQWSAEPQFAFLGSVRFRANQIWSSVFSLMEMRFWSWCLASFSVSRSLVCKLCNSCNRLTNALCSYPLNTSYDPGFVLGAAIKQWTKQPWFSVGGGGGRATLWLELPGKQVKAWLCQVVMRMIV